MPLRFVNEEQGYGSLWEIACDRCGEVFKKAGIRRACASASFLFHEAMGSGWKNPGGGIVCKECGNADDR